MTVVTLVWIAIFAYMVPNQFGEEIGDITGLRWGEFLFPALMKNALVLAGLLLPIFLFEAVKQCWVLHGPDGTEGRKQGRQFWQNLTQRRDRIRNNLTNRGLNLGEAEKISRQETRGDIRTFKIDRMVSRLGVRNLFQRLLMVLLVGTVLVGIVLGLTSHVPNLRLLTKILPLGNRFRIYDGSVYVLCTLVAFLVTEDMVEGC